MSHIRLASSILTIGMITLLAVPATAQDEAAGPEARQWKLSSYRVATQLVGVPFGVSATLLLDTGSASGSGGCNAFSGTYQLDGTSLAFGDVLATTLRLCPENVQTVEDAYLSALPAVAGWTVVDDWLRLVDAAGATVLTFEVSSVALTDSELRGLAANLAALRSDIDALRRDMTGLDVDQLRERVDTLEASSQQLWKQVSALETGASEASKPPTDTFSAAETILLEAIPPRISSRCQPLRAELPKGARAAVACVPNSAAVASVAYYLLEGSDAAAAFEGTMQTFDVLEATSESETCATGQKSRRVYIGAGWQSEGCYRTAGKAELRFVDDATDCRQVEVDGKRLRSPALYIALQGTDGDVARVHEWATRGLSEDSLQITSISQPIPRPDERVSSSCPT